ncbi:MarR family winged helix-turn-helix transcriptional regulator [Streptomyces sp. V4-01]|uniref:MarR family winged helix-turn-helix transcriptional regulator n=1 Tax=Actinacidiphila polyblastidii TaxID=3110430 RepID=A0ABU7P9J0_9ACTN|nr:MarR family winged helix-turn-helix transcriptional regulator [Streptomyces sp. V4-01]
MTKADETDAAPGPATAAWEPPARLRSLPSRMIAHAAMHAERLVNEELAGAGARKWHYAALVALQDKGPASQSELSGRTGIYRSDMVAVVNELAAAGHVERAPDPADRRRNVISLTARGRRHLERLDGLVAAAQEELLAPLGPGEREQLSGLLARLLDHHAARPQGRRPAAGRGPAT